MKLVSRIASEPSHLKIAENADSILSFFKESGFSNSHLQQIVRSRPYVLGAKLENRIRPRIKILQDMGFLPDDIRKIICAGILYLSLNGNIIPSLSVLKGLFGSDSDVVRIVRKVWRIISTSHDNTLLPNVEFMKRCGVPIDRIRSVLHCYPSSFLHKPEVLRKAAEKVKEMGLDLNSKAFVYGVLTVSSFSGETWELKLQAFKGLGFSDSDIVNIFAKSPTVFMVSIEKMRKITELLLSTGKLSLSCFVCCPTSLMFSFEKRHRPRIRVLQILESRNQIQKWPSLASFCQTSDAQFLERFVRPYENEVDDLTLTILQAKKREMNSYARVDIPALF